MSEQIAYCKVSIAPLRSEPADTSEMVSQLLFGEIVHVLEKTKENWYKVQSFSDNYEGYVDPKQIQNLTRKEMNRWMDGLAHLRASFLEIQTPWGQQTVYKGSFLPFEEVDSFNIGNDQFKVVNRIGEFNSNEPYTIANEYLNAPYLWGGKTLSGIDCSGFTQAVFRFIDINLPRDASQQVDYGTEIELDEAESGDVAFFHNKDGKIIHVGILDGKGNIIHASGQVRIDRLDKEGIYREDKELYSHQLNCIKRMC